MELIVAVYADWGIGKDGTQPVALKADRKFFREMTRGAMVIVGRKTVDDFPGKKPLPNRENVVISRTVTQMPGFTVCRSVEEAVQYGENAPRAMVIGGGRIYEAMLPYCDKAYVTKLGCTVACDTYFPNLDEHPDWEASALLEQGEEDGIPYEMWLYTRVKT